MVGILNTRVGMGATIRIDTLRIPVSQLGSPSCVEVRAVAIITPGLLLIIPRDTESRLLI